MSAPDPQTRYHAGAAPSGKLATRADPGLFGPDSVTWRIKREGILLLGAGRALLLQVAHPSIAAAVARHSNFDTDPWGRLTRTLEVVSAITFGDTATSERAAAALAAVHKPIRGQRPDGTAYRAGDPNLLVWVWATLVDSSLTTFSTYVRHLAPGEAHAFYEEQKRFARACGVPEGAWPEDYADFRDYFDDMVETGLRVTPEARGIAAAVLSPPLPTLLKLPARPSVELSKLTTIGLLPLSLREQYGLPWGPVRARLFGSSNRAMRTAVGLTPAPLRQLPAWQ